MVKEFGNSSKKIVRCTLSVRLRLATEIPLTHSAPEYFEKSALKKAKHPTLNVYISKPRTNSESKLKVCES